MGQDSVVADLLMGLLSLIQELAFAMVVCDLPVSCGCGWKDNYQVCFFSYEFGGKLVSMLISLFVPVLLLICDTLFCSVLFCFFTSCLPSPA